MQSDPKQIYELTSKKTGKSEQLYKDIGSFVFSELGKTLKNPKSLIIKLKGVGFFHLRKKATEDRLQRYVNFEKKGFKAHEDELALNRLLQERLLEYDEYLDLKKQTKAKRYMLQVNESLKDLGKIKFGEPCEFKYILTNSSSEILTINKLVKSCNSCTEASINKRILSPGESVDLNVVFTPGITGRNEKSIQILYNTEGNLNVKFKSLIYD